jgi:hypothetical protein
MPLDPGDGPDDDDRAALDEALRHAMPTSLLAG